MKLLEEVHEHSGFKFREAGRLGEYMVLHLCAGMIRDGGSSGGKTMVAVASLQTGITMFMPRDTAIEDAN